MLCVSARLEVVALLELQRPEQREQPQWPVRLHLCDGGCDQSARWRRIRRVRGERGAGTGAPASLLERLPPRPAEPCVFATWKPLFPMGGDSRLSAIENSTHARVKTDILNTCYLRNHVDSLSGSLVRKKQRSWTPRPQAAIARPRRLCEVLAERENEICNFKHPILANRARLSNPPDRAAPGLHPNRRRGHAGNRRGSAAYHGAEPTGACETAPDVGTGALGRRREELVVENSVFCFKAGPTPFHQSSDGQVCRASF